MLFYQPKIELPEPNVICVDPPALAWQRFPLGEKYDYLSRHTDDRSGCGVFVAGMDGVVFDTVRGSLTEITERLLWLSSTYTRSPIWLFEEPIPVNSRLPYSTGFIAGAIFTAEAVLPNMIQPLKKPHRLVAWSRFCQVHGEPVDESGVAYKPTEHELSALELYHRVFGWGDGLGSLELLKRKVVGN